MQQIPVSADVCRGYIGKQVCAVLYDGTEVVGTIRGVHDHGLELEYASNPSASILSVKGKKGKKAAKSKKAGAQTSAFGPWGYGGYGYGFGNVLAWEAITLLFLIPFLFI